MKTSERARQAISIQKNAGADEEEDHLRLSRKKEEAGREAKRDRLLLPMLRGERESPRRRQIKGGLPGE